MDLSDPTLPIPSMDALRNLFGLAKQMATPPDPYGAAGEAVQQYRAGKPLSAFETMFGAMPNTGAIKAYHGSPHSFDRFDLSKIGTGEGAQAYGHGLYFSQAEDVAKSYRDGLSRPEYVVSGKKYPTALDASQAIWDMPGLSEKARYEAGWHINRNYPLNEALDHLQKNSPKDYEALKIAIDSGRIAELPNPGHMYEVRINAEPEHFLDWDKPLLEQSKHIQEKLSAARPELFSPVVTNPRTGLPVQFAQQKTPEQLRQYAEQMGYPITEPANLLSGQKLVFEHGETPASASQRLKEAGIPGIKYLDQGSRGAGEGSRNYVVFDDKLIDIMRKYGFVPFGAGVGMQYGEQSNQK